jgi:hypothetical protein
MSRASDRRLAAGGAQAQLRLLGTPAACARLASLLRHGPPELQVLQASRPYPDRANPRQVRVYLQVRLTRRLTTSAGAAGELVAEAGGHPATLLTAAAEAVRAANHATIRWDGSADGLRSGCDAYDAAGALYLLTSRLPQLSRQLAAILTAAGASGTLTGPHGAPLLAAAKLRQAAQPITAAAARLAAAHQTLGPVGGWLSADAAARAGEGAAE